MPLNADHILTALSGVFCATALLSAIAITRFTHRVLGRGRYSAALIHTWRFGNKAARILHLRGFVAFLVLVAAAAIVVVIRAASPSGLWMAFIPLSIALIQYTGQGMPASILVLGATRGGALPLQGDIMRCVRPIRAIGLMESGDTKHDMTVAGNCFRLSIAAWQEWIVPSIATAAVVVLDVRTGTPHVALETDMLRTIRAWYKTIIVGSAIEGADDAIVVSGAHADDAVVELLRYLFLRKDRLPSASQPLSRLTGNPAIERLLNQPRAMRDDWRRCPSLLQCEGDARCHSGWPS